MLLLAALARPQAGVPTPRRDGTVILAVDVSASMAATDLGPSRIEAAKSAARELVQRQPDNVRIGVVAFGGSGLVTQEATADRAAVLAAIDRLSPQGGTGLGGGLQSHSAPSSVDRCCSTRRATARPGSSRRARTWVTTARR